MKRSSKRQLTLDKLEVIQESKIKTAKQALFISVIYFAESMIFGLCLADPLTQSKNETSVIKLIASILYPLTVLLSLAYLLKAGKDYYDYKFAETMITDFDKYIELTGDQNNNLNSEEFDV